ncbi:cytochrome P450 [Backusella circina FSU 941]|nr:cytochrome P450 [Backusella circina FSU 941]KAI8891344.1 cytochrome P450 [Backusella circina FSU 941]
MNENQSLQQISQHIIAIYKGALLLFLKHRRVSIIIASLLAWLMLKLNNMLRPPKNIRHIPYFGMLGVIHSVFKGERYPESALRTSLPEINSPKSKGIYIKPGRNGWPIYVSNPDAVKKVFMKHEFFPKKDTTAQFLDSLLFRFIGGPNILFSNGEAWKSQRMVANPAFHRSMPVHLFGLLTQELFRTIDKLGKTVDWPDLTQRWTLDAIGMAGFGFDFEAIKDRKSKWILAYEKINKGFADKRYFVFPFLDKHFLWMQPERRAIHQKLDCFLKMLDGVIENKRQELKEGRNANTLLNEKDLLTLMLEAEADGEGTLTNEELKKNICIFFFAGHDTTASALSATVYYLAKNQDIQQNARMEALHILGDEPEDVLPTLEQTKQMTYINQIMKETLRINGPVPHTLPRIVTEDTELCGVFIPKGSTVTVNLHDLHHSEKLWKDPFVFDPERFSENGEGTRAAGEGISWAPFGYGSRQCIGMNFSLNEQRVLLSMLLRKFTFTLPDDSIHQKELIVDGTLTLSPVNLNITFKKRY